MKWTDPKTGERWDAGWYGNAFIVTCESYYRQLAMPPEFAREMFKAFSEPTPTGGAE